ncbi:MULTISPECIES: phosphate-starvation-inducible PsiE family protein [unclassified Pseudofrankia]|uniref:phosphate-starvation-inducible PsiE family protein n=1 Tax=unclassified Pseudofrankia TaxID=2994372 RepID=UPI0008D96EF8|nr:MULTISPECIES: phosphate-starvation-inducible PsiE family protein [unclassified Pseudofrankia]MDT3439988.1 phosphate-starvation-inducible PsiE family protein [Pseudofrankia sp. BMG5.37]
MAESSGQDAAASPASPGGPSALGNLNRPESPPLRLLLGAQYVLLYLISVVLLAVGAGVLYLTLATVLHGSGSWTARFVVAIEELLLILIIVEILVTIETRLEGGRLQLEPFIIVGIIALVRHVLSVVVVLTIPETPAESRQRLIELAVDAGAVFVLIAALALARWSQRRFDTGEPG